MKFLSRLSINFLLVFLLEEVYFGIHMELSYHTGTIFSGVILPGILILFALVITNHCLNRIGKLHLTLHPEMLASLIGICLVILLQFIRPVDNPDSIVGKEFVNLLISLLLLAETGVIWLLRWKLPKQHKPTK